MHAGCHADDDTLARSVQKIALEFDGGKTLRPLGEIRDGPVTAGGIGDGNDDGSMQVSVGGQQLRAQDQAAGGTSRLDGGKFDPDQAG